MYFSSDKEIRLGSNHYESNWLHAKTARLFICMLPSIVNMPFTSLASLMLNGTQRTSFSCSLNAAGCVSRLPAHKATFLWP